MAKPVIPLQLAKDHLVVEHSFDDTLITYLCETAAERTLQEIGLAGLLERETAETSSPSVKFFAPVSEILSVESLSGEAWLTVPTEDYELSGNPDKGYSLTIDGIAPRWRVKWENGYSETPSWFVTACLFLVAHYYQNRSSVVVGSNLSAVEVPGSFLHLTAPHRKIHFA